jgi:hypothetical protein
MNRGYIKLWRKMEDSGLMQRPEIFTFAAWCLFRASYKERKVLHGGQVIPLEPGQFIFGRKAAAEAHWATYQNDDQPSDQQNDHVPTSNRPATDHKQEVKEVKKVKKKEKDLPPEALRLAGVLSELILRNNPENRECQPSKREATIKRWAVEIDRMHRIDKREWDHIERCIRWCQDHHFWAPNIASGEKLRKQYDQMLMQAKTESAGGNGKKSAAALAMEMTLEARDEELRGEGFDNGYLELLPKPEDGAGPY